MKDNNTMFTLNTTLALSFERGTMLVWDADGILACDTRDETIVALHARGVDAAEAIDAIHACLAVAREMAVTR